MLETRALVVDDDAILVAVFGELLRGSIRQVDQARDGDAALALFREHRHALVVLDLIMPKMSGLDVLRRIRAIDPRSQVVIVTGYPTTERVIEALNLHAFGFLEKPVRPGQIRTMLAEAYARYQQELGEIPAHEAEISSLYKQLAALSAVLERSPDSEDVRQAYDQCFERLRDMQRQEAAIASQLFRENLALKKGSGYASIEAARRLLDRDKRPA
jgi:DNA-binding NtrC family response regulator